MSRKKATKATKGQCITEGCANPRAPGKRYCQLCCWTITFSKHVDKSQRRGDLVGTLIGMGGAFLFDGIRTGKISTGNGPSVVPMPPGFRPRPQQRPSAPPPQVDPFSILGLNARHATEADVRRIQRSAAEMWHADKGGGAEAQSRLGEINAAAEECLRQIRARP